MAYIEFIDRNAGETAGCVVRAPAPGVVALGLTLEASGDLETFMDPDVAERVAAELLAAARDARHQSTE
jgi:hypothetical protein